MPLGWYRRFAWYDDLRHAASGFAIACTIVAWLMKVGDRVLLPAVRSAAKDAFVLADGFSCRTQIAQATPRRALHLADVLEMAALESGGGPSGEYPERSYVPEYGGPPSAQALVAVAAAAMGIGAAAGAFLKRRR